MSYVILDTETTGHEDGDVIHVAVLNPFGPSFDSKVAPTKRILPAAMATHGITDAEAATFPPLDSVRDAFREYIRSLPHDIVVIGHNVDFDAAILQRNFNVVPQRLLDTLRMAKKLIRQEDIGGYRLDHVYVYLFPDKLQDLHLQRVRHDAMTDCKLTKDVYTGLVERLGKQEPELNAAALSVREWVMSPMLIEKWPFGKHKGKPLSCDMDYAAWYMRQKDTDPDIAFSLAQLRSQKTNTRYTRM